MGGSALAARAGQPFGGRDGGGEGCGEKWLPMGPLLAGLPAGTSLEAVRPLGRENVSGTVIAVLISLSAPANQVGQRDGQHRCNAAPFGAKWHRRSRSVRE